MLKAMELTRRNCTRIQSSMFHCQCMVLFSFVSFWLSLFGRKYSIVQDVLHCIVICINIKRIFDVSDHFNLPAMLIIFFCFYHFSIITKQITMNCMPNRSLFLEKPAKTRKRVGAEAAAPSQIYLNRLK